MPRFARFVGVAIPGFGLQLCVVALLSGSGVHYLAATFAGLELALLNNFLWHRSWTWRDRSSLTIGQEVRRLARFHVSNGALSATGHLILVPFSVQMVSAAPIVGNIVAVLSCGLANFVLADRYVFQPPDTDHNR